MALYASTFRFERSTAKELQSLLNDETLNHVEIEASSSLLPLSSSGPSPGQGPLGQTGFGHNPYPGAFTQLGHDPAIGYESKHVAASYHLKPCREFG
ncbi:hypothetical protein ABVK25_006007 [Lepraria finkii]|uniref:Uncharacterized protein n=1 Tax=Lepraria finkii TaxID=1340010 RepID=A0ABR4B8E3_9LECA